MRWPSATSGEMLGHPHQVGVRQVGQQVVHGDVLAAAVAEGHHLVVQVAGRLAGQAREVDVLDAAPLRAVAAGAGLHPCFHGVRDAIGGSGLGQGGAGVRAACDCD
jgi:hypothetical protein